MLIRVAALYGQHCITAEDGERLHTQITGALESGEDVELDFNGTGVFASPFFNAMVGTLLRDYTPEQLNRRVQFLNLNPETVELLRRVIKNSREYFANPKVKRKLDELSDEPGESGRHRL